MIRNGKFCKYHGNEFKVNRDSDGNTIILTKNDKIIDSTFIDKKFHQKKQKSCTDMQHMQ